MIRTRKRRCKEFFDNPTQVEVHREVQPQAPGPLHGLVLHPRISHRPGRAHREGTRAGPEGESRGGWRGAGGRGGKPRRRARGRDFGWCGAASFRGRCGGKGAAGAPRERTSSIPTRDLPPHLPLFSPGGLTRATPPRGLSQRPQSKASEGGGVPAWGGMDPEEVQGLAERLRVVRVPLGVAPRPAPRRAAAPPPAPPAPPPPPPLTAPPERARRTADLEAGREPHPCGRLAAPARSGLPDACNPGGREGAVY